MDPQTQSTTPVYRYDGAAYVRANAALVKRNQQLLTRLDGPDSWLRTRKDDNMTAFLARQLVYERGRIEARIYGLLRAAEFVPIETGHPRGAEGYSTHMLSEEGEAKITHGLAGDDPRVDVTTEEDLRKYVNVRASYGYTVEELEKAALARVPLPRWKSNACARAIATKVDQIGRSGNAAAKLTGFFNDANITLLTLTNGEWETATVDEILADLNEIEDKIIEQTLDTQEAFEGEYVLTLPTTAEGRISTTPRATGSDMSIKNWFLANARVIKRIERYKALDSATGDDVAAADPPQGICYPRDPEVLFWPMPITYEEQAPQLQGWEWVTRARARLGGVDWRFPSHALYIENFD